MKITDLRTPCVLVDRTRMTQNLRRMQTAAGASGLRLRPHAKTHKSVALAQLQVDGGAVGICCAKLGEAEVFADAGIGDIRLPYPLNPANADRVLALRQRTHLSFIVDHPDIADEWSRAMTAAGASVDVLVKVDVGFHRCGIDPHTDGAVDFITHVAESRGLRFRGLLSHAGHGYHAASEADLGAIAAREAEILTRLAAQVRDRGVNVDEISVGATPTARFSLREQGLTEMRPGNYVYFDRTQVALGAASFNDCALTVLARVVTKPAGDRLILDCGSKTLTNDLARGFTPTPGYGSVLSSITGEQTADDGLVIERLSEEHATVRALAGRHTLRPGDLVRIVPNHSCVVSNLVDAAWTTDGEQVLEAMTISARGRIT